VELETTGRNLTAGQSLGYSHGPVRRSPPLEPGLPSVESPEANSNPRKAQWKFEPPRTNSSACWAAPDIRGLEQKGRIMIRTIASGSLFLTPPSSPLACVQTAIRCLFGASLRIRGAVPDARPAREIFRARRRGARARPVHLALQSSRRHRVTVSNEDTFVSAVTRNTKSPSHYGDPRGSNQRHTLYGPDITSARFASSHILQRCGGSGVCGDCRDSSTPS